MSCSIGQSWYRARIPSRMAVHAKTRSTMLGAWSNPCNTYIKWYIFDSRFGWSWYHVGIPSGMIIHARTRSKVQRPRSLILDPWSVILDPWALIHDPWWEACAPRMSLRSSLVWSWSVWLVWFRSVRSDQYQSVWSVWFPSPHAICKKIQKE